MEELGTPFVCTVNADGSPDFTLMPDPPKDADRNFSPAGRLIDPEKADQMVKDSVDRGAPTREIATASRYLMLAAMSICNDSMNAFEHYLDAKRGLPAGERRVHGAGWAQGRCTDPEHPRRYV